MRKRALTPTLVGILLLGIIVYVSGERRSGLTSYQLSASWPYRYADVAELASDADLVIVGVATRSSSTADRTHIGMGAALVFTDFTVDVREVLKGTQGAGGQVVVRQTGGRHGNISQEIRDDPMLEMGKDYVLFLQKDPSSDRFKIIGGPQGRFVLDGGKVTSLSLRYPGRDIRDLGIDGIQLANFRMILP